MNDLNPKTAKLFWTGRSQAVRLPREFRFEGAEVRIRREGERVILEPEEDAETWARRIAGSMDDDFARAVEEGRAEPDYQTERASFD